MKLSSIINDLIGSTPFLELYLDKKVINLSSLSKRIKNYFESKELRFTEASILMSLKRFSPPFFHKRKNIFYHISDTEKININSNLLFQRIEKNSTSKSFLERISYIQESEQFQYKIFETESSISYIIKTKNRNNKLVLPDNINVLETRDNLALINLSLTNEDIRIPGLYYLLFKQLAWNNINIFEIQSSGREIMLLINNSDVKNIFNIIQQEKNDIFEMNE